MEDVLAVRDEYRAQQWEMVVQECAASGLSIREFCRQRGITEKTFYYWQRKLRTQILESASPKLVPLEPLLAPGGNNHLDRAKNANPSRIEKATTVFFKSFYTGKRQQPSERSSMEDVNDNGLHDIIAQTIEEMKHEQGKNFSLDKINLAEL